MEEMPEEDKNGRGDDGDGEGAGGKKFKNDDGGWSPRPKRPASDESDKGQSSAHNEDVNEDNIDSGISADKSETEDRTQESTSAREPDNSVIDAGPSTSTVAVIFNLIRPFSSRNYRRHRRGNLSGDANSSNSSSDVDSDDISIDDTANQSSRPDAEERTRSVSLHSEDGNENLRDSSDDQPERPSHTDSSSDNDNLSESDVAFSPSDTDSPDDFMDSERAHDNDDEYQTPSVLLKPKPKHNWFVTKELINRELGLTVRPGVAAKSDAIFEQRYYGSLHTVYRLELMYKLDRHRGCVNAINFHPEGHLLASGSDDLSVVVWDWEVNSPRAVIKTGHKGNVFQSKFLYLNARSQLNIATCARDGQVRLLQCHPSGGSSVVRRKLMTHARSAHKLHVTAAEPHLIMSCGEDGLVQMADVRTDRPNKLLTVREKESPVALYSIHGHPLEPRELLVAGRNSTVRIYDRRKATKPVAQYCPTSFNETEGGASKRRSRLMQLYVTCAVYNHDGSEILASYNDEDIYLFDTVNDKYEKDVKKEGFTRRYSGHRNSATFKGVAFFGPQSEFVVSGSDCSYIYIWDKKTEAIVQWMLGDEGGVVNCIESHPRCPILASSGLDKDVKIWVPSNEKDPIYQGLKEVVRENSKHRVPFLDGIFPALYSHVMRDRGDDLHARAFDDLEPNVCTAF